MKCAKLERVLRSVYDPKREGDSGFCFSSFAERCTCREEAAEFCYWTAGNAIDFGMKWKGWYFLALIINYGYIDWMLRASYSWFLSFSLNLVRGGGESC